VRSVRAAREPALFHEGAAQKPRDHIGAGRAFSSILPVVSCVAAVPTTTIAAENLDKSFSGVPLFCGLTFAASRGLVAVAGKNGSGKTTLLKILAGLARPTAGRVRLELEGGPALTTSERRLAVGWAGPDLALYGELTAAENLLFFRRAAGRAASAGDARRRLAEVGLADAAMDRRVEEFSTGLKQRLRLAFARLFDPPVLVLDEPMAGLDLEGRETVLRAVADARRLGPVFLASNDERDFIEPEQRIELGTAAARAS
jgi:heme exporter protein A